MCKYCTDVSKVGGFAQQVLASGGLLGNWRFCPASRIDSAFVHFLNGAANVVSDELAQRLVLHRGIGFGSYGLPEVQKSLLGQAEAV